MIGIYKLILNDDLFYIGSSKNIDRRIAKHNKTCYS